MGKVILGETKWETFFFFSSMSSASPHFPSPHLMLAKKCVLIAKRSRGAVRAVL